MTSGSCPANYPLIATIIWKNGTQWPIRDWLQIKDISSNDLVGHGLKFILHLLQECLHHWDEILHGLGVSLGHLPGAQLGGAASDLHLYFRLLLCFIFVGLSSLCSWVYVYMCIFHYFNYYLPGFVTTICLEFIFGFLFLDICFNLS